MLKIKKFYNPNNSPVSDRAFKVHLKQHYEKYVETVNQYFEEMPVFKTFSIEQLIKSLDPHKSLGQHVSQVFNHEFFFMQFTGNIDNYDLPWNYDKLVEDIINESKKIFGSGYIWLIYNRTLNIYEVQCTDSPAYIPKLGHSKTLILNIDLWEHAYYLDYESDRILYIKNCLKAIDWKVIKSRM
jgi:Fe-Mn family superoxide dismutase